jgi:hypothetical protein
MKQGFSISFFALMATFSSCFGQQMAGIVGSNYAGTFSIYANPANVVDSRYKVYVNLAGLDFFVGNNALKWQAPYSLVSYATSQALNNKKKQWQPENIGTINRPTNKNLNNIVQMMGPAILFSINDKQAVSISSRGRSFTNFKGVSSELMSLFVHAPGSSQRAAAGQNQSLAVNFNNTVEIALNYGQDIALNNTEAIKVGLSVKRIIGLSNFHFVAKDSDFQLVTAFDPNNVLYEGVLNLQKLNARYGYSDERRGVEDFNFRPGYWLGKPSPGRTYGFDIGLVYESRPDIQKHTSRRLGKVVTDMTQNKYKFKIGAALIDIGSVKFDNTAYVSNYQSVTQNRLVFENNMTVFPLRSMVNGINQSLNTDVNSNRYKFRSHLPTTLHLSGDVHVQKNYYVGAHLVQNLHLGKGVGMTMPSSVSVTPRYESKWLDLALPLSLLNNYQLLTLGMAARLGPVFVGSDNLQGLFGIGKPRGSNLYAGASIPIYHKLPASATRCYTDNKSNMWKKAFGKARKPKKQKAIFPKVYNQGF